MNSSLMTRSDVPVFENTMSSYAEHRKRAVLYSMKMKLDGKREPTAVTTFGELTLEADGALDSLLKLLEARFKYDKCLKST